MSGVASDASFRDFCERQLPTVRVSLAGRLRRRDGYAQNQIWCQIVALACEMIAWTQLPALTSDARR
jgi:hypothetical protein